MNLKPGFSRFLEAAPGRLHFAAHSHHPWPNVSYDAHRQAWEDAAELVDDKWDHIFGTVMPSTRQGIADTLSLADPDNLVFAPNTHEFVVRIFSCFERPVRVLTTDAEFHSMSRQLRRWQEQGSAIVEVVPGQPYADFTERFTTAARAGGHDLVFLSHVFFDSGHVVRQLDRIVASVSDEKTFIVVDGYHAFMAMPVDLASIQERAFYLAGGYKYAMSGEGVCFLHCPPGFGSRPENTGWYAGFGSLTSTTTTDVPYGADASRFAGATFDPSGVYRMGAVLSWLDSNGVTPADIRAHVSGLQEQFLQSEQRLGDLVVTDPEARGNFLAFQTSQAERLYQALHDLDVITDYRGDRLRVGFGVYQDEKDVEQLIARLSTVRF